MSTIDSMSERYQEIIEDKDAEIERLEAEAQTRLEINGRMRVELANAQTEIKRLWAAQSMTDIGWRSIETAPRDGSRFLGCDGVFVGVCKRYDPGGRYECWVGESHEPWRAKPISWMPLPEPPDYNLEPKQ